MKNTKKQITTQQLVLGAILTAIVVVLQLMGSFIKFGPFSISLVLIPIVNGAATCGAAVGAWLGLMFGFVVLVSGDAAAFLSVNALGTIVTVLLKGTLCGYLAALTYKVLEKKNRLLAVLLSAMVCPLVNTGIFLLGCVVFFYDTIAVWATQFGFGDDVVKYMFIGLAGGNFVVEFIVNIVVSPIIVRLLNIKKK